MLVATAAPALAQRADTAHVTSLDSLLNTHISAASKYAQTSAEAPASVTILTADDLERFGYRTLSEALESVRGFYLSNDRDYPYLGTRGFSRPTDYNNRVLVLVDGHSINDQTWGGAPVGSDLPINFDAVERIEIVRGPGSTLYGTSAMFAVINVVTKSGSALNGAVVRAQAGSAGLRQATVAAGHAFGTGAAVSLSGIATRQDGSDIYFPEFDKSNLNGGVAHGLDWERAIGGLGSFTAGPLTAHAGYRSRAKGIPSAPFGVSFNDPRAESVDETSWADVAGLHEFGPALRTSLRLFADRYRYRGVYPYGSGTPFTDGGGSSSLGGELLGIWEPSSRNRLTTGTEVRRVLRAEYYERAADGTVTRDDAPSSITSIFAQDELQVCSSVTLVGGLRLERTTRHGTAAAPRLAVILTPTRATTIKALFGEAFRAPSAAEADITTTYYSRNPALQPERIRTFEVTLEHRVSDAVLLSSSLYSYGIRDLIDQVETQSGTGAHFANQARSEAAGAEAEIDLRPAGPFMAHATYAYGHADGEPINERLSNSPEQIATVSMSAKSVAGVRPTIAWRYESGRRTLGGPSTPAFVRTDANMNYAPTRAAGLPWLGGVIVSTRVTNVFDVRYAAPAGLEHTQTAIPQEGRAVSVQLSWHF